PLRIAQRLQRDSEPPMRDGNPRIECDSPAQRRQSFRVPASLDIKAAEVRLDAGTIRLQSGRLRHRRNRLGEAFSFDQLSNLAERTAQWRRRRYFGRRS